MILLQPAHLVVGKQKSGHQLVGQAVACSSSLIPDPLRQQKNFSTPRVDPGSPCTETCQTQVASAPHGPDVSVAEEAWISVYLILQMCPRECG